MAKDSRKRFRQRARDFGDEVGQLGERFGDRMARRGERFGERMESRGKAFGERMRRRGEWFGATVVVSPWSAVLAFVFGAIFLALGVWLLKFFSGITGVAALSLLAGFVSANFGLLLLVLLVSSFLDYLQKTGFVLRILAWPFSFAIGWTVLAWIGSAIVLEGGYFAGHQFIQFAAVWLSGHLPGVFAFTLVIGYFIAGLGALLFRSAYDNWEDDAMAKRHSRRELRGKDDFKGPRLYRSGREKILGGVCGGIAEYFGVDPTIVRILWILMTLAWGFGLLLYVILWIIVPRNPRDKW